MESYVIHTQLYENWKYVFVEINHLNDAPQSVRECRFQTIGWILHIYEKSNSLLDDWEEIGQRGNVRIALIELASMDEEVSRQLVRAIDWRERFEIVWPMLSNQERKQALSYRYDDEDNINYWPGFDIYNQILLRYVEHSSDNVRPQVFNSLQNQNLWRPHLRKPPMKIIIEEWDGDGAIRIPDVALQELELDVGGSLYLIEEFVGNTRCIVLSKKPQVVERIDELTEARDSGQHGKALEK